LKLAVGEKIGSCEVIEIIGQGGMGEVYRARDTKLKRDVAIKVMSGRFADDPDSNSWFSREAEVLASLNHPSIAGIYGVEEHHGARCLVLELVAGETLQDRLRSGPIPVEEALQIAKAIAEALEAAHQKGIVHRDLKPGNVKTTPEGKVKVLDFGLARILQPASQEQDLSQSPTQQSAPREGFFLGTPSYMSPEQARGQLADRLSDIWAFGALFYEMLSGKQAFAGDTLTDIMGGIVKVDPDWSVLPETVPATIRSLLRRCLRKNRESRLHDIADVRIEIEEALAGLGSSVDAVPAGAVKQNPVAVFLDDCRRPVPSGRNRSDNSSVSVLCSQRGSAGPI
jgi:eukaryotic-like serine/threonine-protein kinase